MNAVRAGAPLQVGDVRLIPVVRVWRTEQYGHGAAWAAGGCEPVAVVIMDAKRPRAVNMAGEAVDPAPLLAEVEGLAAALKMPRSG